jgi:hypothetical protein
MSKIKQSFCRVEPTDPQANSMKAMTIRDVMNHETEKKTRPLSDKKFLQKDTKQK